MEAWKDLHSPSMSMFHVSQRDPARLKEEALEWLNTSEWVVAFCQYFGIEQERLLTIMLENPMWESLTTILDQPANVVTVK